MNPVTVKLDTPPYIGFTVLELSKIDMFMFHYDKMKVWYPDTKVLASYTNGFIYEVTCRWDFYKSLKTQR